MYKVLWLLSLCFWGCAGNRLNSSTQNAKLAQTESRLAKKSLIPYHKLPRNIKKMLERPPLRGWQTLQAFSIQEKSQHYYELRVQKQREQGVLKLDSSANSIDF